MNPLNEPVHGPTGPQTVGGLTPITDSRAQGGKGRQRPGRKGGSGDARQAQAAPPRQDDEGHVDVLA